jgi:insulysin
MLGYSPLCTARVIMDELNTLDVSPFDDRKYEAFTLPNGLEVLVACDESAEQAGACMCVKAGAVLDPFPGVAHLLEHLLFVSSVKYPELHSYQEYVSRHSGQTNAFTSSQHTTYFFQIPNASFEEAFDRFAQFFSGPSFVPSAVEREIKAVDSENTKNLLSDSWRLLQVCVEGSFSRPAQL